MMMMTRTCRVDCIISIRYVTQLNTVAITLTKMTGRFMHYAVSCGRDVTIKHEILINIKCAFILQQS